MRRFARSLAERRTGNPDAGDTLLEVLLALVVLGIASLALIIAFGTSITASADHRTVTNFESMLTTASQEAIFAIQNDTSVWQSCPQSLSSYPPITLPAPYGPPTGTYTVDYTTPSGTGTPAVQYWDGNGFSTNCPSNPANASQLITIGIVGTSYTNSFVVSSPLSVSGTSVNTGNADGLVFTTQPAGALGGIPFTTQPVVEVESNGYPVVNDISPIQLTITSVSGIGVAVPGCSGVPQDGVDTFSGCTIDTPGTYTITASNATLSTVSDSFTVGTADYHLVYTTPPVGGASGSVFARDPVISVENAANLVDTAWTGSITMNFSGGLLASCAGSTSSTSVTVTALNGVAALPSTCTFAGGYLYNPVSGVTLATPYTISASANGSSPAVPATSNTFAVSDYGTASQLVFTTEPSGAANTSATAVFTGQPVVTVEDSYGNTVTSGFTSPISIAINPSSQGVAGCSYTLSYGVATFAGCHGTSSSFSSGLTLTASTTAPGVSSATSTTFNITGVATQLLFTTQPKGALSGATLATEPVVTFEDLNGNVVTAETAAVTLTPSGGKLSICTGLVPQQGISTIENCTFSGTVGQLYTLTATSGSLSVVSEPFWLTGAGAVSQLAFSTQPVAGASGSLLTTQPEIDVEDSAGNIETTSSDSMTLTTAGGILSGCTGLSAIDGVVDVANCSFAGLVNTAYTMTASDGSISTQSDPFSPTGPGVPSQILLNGCQSTLNAASPCSLTATIVDFVGNVETLDNASSITFAYQPDTGAGTVSGLTSVTVAGGAASDVVTGVDPGSVAVAASADGFTSLEQDFAVLSTSNISVVSTTGSPSVVGQPVTYTATVTPTSTNPVLATGNVVFFDGGSPISGCGAQPLSGTATDTATCVVSYTSTTGSPHTITAQYQGNPSTYFAATALSSSISQFVNVAATSTSVVSTTGSPSVVGQPVTYTATVTVNAPGSGKPTGNVEFFDGGTKINTCTAQTLSTTTETATCVVTYTSTTGSPHTITAQYQGETNAYSPSAMSGSISQTVGMASTTTGLASNDTTAAIGQKITYTATVSVTSGGGMPSTSDTVTFSDSVSGAISCGAGSVAFNGATATCVVVYTTTTNSPHSVTATFNGDATSYGASTSNVVSESVSAASTTTGLASTDTTAVVGQTITYTATVAITSPGSGTPSTSDTVTFNDSVSGAISCGAGSVSFNGTTATCVVVYTTTVNSPHRVTATFNGDATSYGASTSNVVSESVSIASTKTTLASDDTTAVVGQTITYTATVSVTSGGGTPSTSDTVTFRDATTGAISCGAGSVSFNGTTATCVVVYTTTTHSPHSVTATFNGDTTSYGASTASAVSESVSAAATTTSVLSNLEPSTVGQTVTYTATVSVNSPGSGTIPTSDTVTFKDATTGTISCGAGSVAFNGTTATCAVTYATFGQHQITAVFGGDANFSTSTSLAEAQTVNAQATTVAVVSGTNPAVVGQSVTFTATVTTSVPGAGSPTGTVEFLNGGLAITGCTAQPVSTPAEMATCTTSITASGGSSIIVVYSGDSVFLGSTSPVLTQTTNAAATSTSVASSASPVVAGQSVTFTATVKVTAPGGGLPTGTVSFLNGGLAITGCTAQTLSGNSPDTATCTTSFANDNAGTAFSITAKYAGVTGTYTTSTSPAISQSVTIALTATSTVTSANPSGINTAVTYTATVAATAPSTGIPTGAVEFFDGGTPITGCTAKALTGTATDTATCSVTYTALGSHTITATYGGSTNAYNTSTSTAFTQKVYSTFGGGSAGDLTKGTKDYFALSGTSTGSTTPTRTGITPLSASTTLTGLTVTLAGGTATAADVFTVGTVTGTTFTPIATMTCTVANGATSCTVTGTWSVSSGSYLAIYVVTPNSGSTIRYTASWTVTYTQP